MRRTLTDLTNLANRQVDLAAGRTRLQTVGRHLDAGHDLVAVVDVYSRGSCPPFGGVNMATGSCIPAAHAVDGCWEFSRSQGLDRDQAAAVLVMSPAIASGDGRVVERLFQICAHAANADVWCDQSAPTHALPTGVEPCWRSTPWTASRSANPPRRRQTGAARYFEACFPASMSGVIIIDHEANIGSSHTAPKMTHGWIDRGGEIHTTVRSGS